MPEREEKSEKEEVQWIPVRVIGTEGKSAFVEWETEGKLYRAFVPAGTVKNGQVTAKNLERGKPYGIPWEQFLDLSDVTVDVIANKLRRNGMWTFGDWKRLDRKTIKMGTDLIGGAVLRAAHRARAKGWED